MKHLWLCLLFTALLAGCSSVESRIKKHPATYASLSENDQRLVSRGNIREGLSQDAVYIAWGKPDDVIRGSAKGKPFETWVYNAFDDEAIVHGPMIPIRGRYFGPYDIYPIYEPVYVQWRYPYRSVTFQGGRVVEWADATR